MVPHRSTKHLLLVEFNSQRVYMCVSTSSHRWVHVHRWCRFSCRGPPPDPQPPPVRTDVGECWCLWSTCCSLLPCAALTHTDIDVFTMHTATVLAFEIFVSHRKLTFDLLIEAFLFLHLSVLFPRLPGLLQSFLWTPHLHTSLLYLGCTQIKIHISDRLIKA